MELSFTANFFERFGQWSRVSFPRRSQFSLDFWIAEIPWLKFLFLVHSGASLRLQICLNLSKMQRTHFHTQHNHHIAWRLGYELFFELSI